MARIIAVLATLAALCTPIAAHAGPSNDPLTFVMDDQYPKIHQPVGHETWCGDCVGVDYTTQEPWVINPTSCMWDVDDQFRYVSVGNVLAAGATATVNDCLLKGSQSVAVSTRFLSSPSPNLIVTYAFTWDGGSESTVAVPRFADHRWNYNICFRPLLLAGERTEVPDSHGGTAVPIDITVSVHNPTSQKVGKTGGLISFGWLDYFAAC